MGLFEKFAKVESHTIEIIVLPELGTEPAFVVTARVLPEREFIEASERYSENGQLNFKKYRPWWARRIIVDWRDLTANNLRRLIPGIQLDEQKIRQLFGDGSVPYSAEVAADLHLNALTNFAAPINRRLDEERQTMKDEAEDALRAAQGNSHAGSDSPSA